MLTKRLALHSELSINLYKKTIGQIDWSKLMLISKDMPSPCIAGVYFYCDTIKSPPSITGGVAN